jgi:hypothetical protein
VPDECALKRVREDLDPLVIEFIKKPVFDSTRESPRESARKSGLLCLSAEERIAVMHARTGFFTRQKSRTDLYALGSQSKSCDDSAGIGDASGSNHRDRDGVCDLRYERERPGK